MAQIPDYDNRRERVETMDDRRLCARVVAEVKKAVVGKDEVVVKLLLAFLARGHVLLEDIPGVGKTTMALAFSRAMGLSYSRVQFTPDVLPSDITGYSIYQKETGAMVYQPGAVLTNVFLADELNRATSRTQSALLEAMEEGQVTVDGVTHPLPQPFFVIATQNPTGASGTQLLPDSQMDRFTIRLSIGYPAAEDERDLSRVELSLPLFETYVRGYLSACGNALTEAEKNLLPLGAKIMTLECGVRFLTDYLQGDTYFHTSRPGQNLDRARTQLRLVEDMERKWARMEEIAAHEGRNRGV